MTIQHRFCEINGGQCPQAHPCPENPNAVVGCACAACVATFHETEAEEFAAAQGVTAWVDRMLAHERTAAR